MPSVVPEAPTSGDGGLRAPTYNVPQQRIVSIEHPCVVQNFRNGFNSLGGEQQVKHVLDHEVGDPDIHPKKKKNVDPEPVVGVSLRPDDPFAKRIPSTAIQTQNVLLKVTVPKRTGRKRKRGSDEPFTAYPQFKNDNNSITAPELLQRLRDNPKEYTLEAVGMIQDTHRFRHLPDFQLRAAELPIMREIRDHTMEAEYDLLKKFHIDLKPGCEGITAFPGPPSFVPPGQMYRYEYQELLGVRGDRKPKTNVQRSSIGKEPVARPTELRLAASTIIPEKPPPDLPPPSSTTPSADVSSAIEALQKLFEDWPIVTKHAAVSILWQKHETSTTMEAVPYIAYLVERGPWQDTIVRYGVDPRKDPKYRFYQTIELQLDDADAMKAAQDRVQEGEQTHIFDGKTSVRPERLWQLCNLTDPVLRNLVYKEGHRTECDPDLFGWYHNGTLAKIRVILKDKLTRLAKKATLLSDGDYDVIASLPAEIEQASDCRVDLSSSSDEVKGLCGAVGQEAMRGPTRPQAKKGMERKQVPFDNAANDGSQDGGGRDGDGHEDEIEGEGQDGEHAGGVLSVIQGKNRDLAVGDNFDGVNPNGVENEDGDVMNV